MKKSLSFYLSSQLNDSVSNTDLKEAQELSQYLDSILLEHSEMITEGFFGDRIKKLFGGSKEKKEEKGGAVLGGILSMFGLGPSEYEKAMNDMYKENASKAAERAKKLADQLEDTRIAKLKAKNTARQSMLDQTNNKKIDDLKSLQKRYEDEANKWKSMAGNSRSYSEAEINAITDSLETLGTILPPSEQTLASRAKEMILKAAINEDGTLKSEDEIKNALEEARKTLNENDEFTKFFDKQTASIKNNASEKGIQDVFKNYVGELTGYTSKVENADQELEEAQEALNNLQGNLDNEGRAAVDNYQKAVLENVKLKLEAGEELSDDEKKALEKMPKKIADSLFKDGDSYMKGITVDPDSGKVTVDIDKLKTSCESNNDVLAAIQKIADEATDETRGAKLEEYCEKHGLPKDTFSGDPNNIKNLTKDSEVIKQAQKKADEIAKEKVKKNEKKMPENPAKNYPAEDIEQYINIQHEGPDNEAIKQAQERVKEAEANVQRKKDIAKEMKERLADIKSQELSRELNDKVLIPYGDEKITLKEYKERTKCDAGEQIDDKGKRYIEVDGKKIYRPDNVDPDSEEMQNYEKARIKKALKNQKPKEPAKKVTIKDGKYYLDGQEVDLSSDETKDDLKAEVAKSIAEQEAAETYKKDRQAIITNFKSALKDIVAGKDVKDPYMKEFMKDYTADGKIDVEKITDFLKELPDIKGEDGEIDVDKLKDFLKDMPEDVKNKLSEEEYVDNSEDPDNSDDSDDPNDDDESNNNTEDDKKPVNPKKIWKRKKNKATGAMTKNYYYVGGKSERKGESISKDLYKEKIQNYKKKLAAYKEKHSSETQNSSLTSYLKNAVLESKVSPNTKLRDFLLENLK